MLTREDNEALCRVGPGTLMGALMREYWVPVLEDLHRFVGYGRNRRGFEERNQAFTTGDRLTGLMFGRDALVARLYDKTQEIRRRGISWLPDLWGIDGQSEPVCRLEFQFRRKVLVEFHLRSVEDTLASLQDLWRYAVGDWLSLRMPTTNQQRTRWHVDPPWQEIQVIEMAPSCTGVVRRRLEQATLQRIVQGLWGYVTSLAALRDRLDLEDALLELRRQLEITWPPSSGHSLPRCCASGLRGRSRSPGGRSPTGAGWPSSATL